MSVQFAFTGTSILHGHPHAKRSASCKTIRAFNFASVRSQCPAVRAAATKCIATMCFAWSYHKFKDPTDAKHLKILHLVMLTKHYGSTHGRSAVALQAVDVCVTWSELIHHSTQEIDGPSTLGIHMIMVTEEVTVPFTCSPWLL